MLYQMISITRLPLTLSTINLPSGAVIVIPPRPFLHPTMLKYRNEVIENYREALLSILK